MCGYALNLMSIFILKSKAKLIFLLDIKLVYYGCKNERFGGNGSVMQTNIMFPHSYNSISIYYILFMGNFNCSLYKK